MTNRILIADDEKPVRQLLELMLQSHGYQVISARNGDHLIRLAQEHTPDLILVDLMMPGLDGYEAIRQMRNDTRTAHIPMIILTARSAPDDVVSGFETGADDYITKPFNISELIARIKGQLRRAALPSVRNPLSGLPGNVLISEEIKFRIKRGEPFALLYIDMDNFKAFNDTYGFSRGDRVITSLAKIITTVLADQGTSSDFAGHIGGDDFAVLTTPAQIDTLASSIICAFDHDVRNLYDEADLERGYLRGIDRHGIVRQFPIVSISIGVVTNRTIHYTDHEEVTRVAADMKHFAKQRSGSSYAVDVRSPSNGEIDDDRRGRILPGVLVLSADEPLLALLHTALVESDYRGLEARNVPEAHALLAHPFAVELIVIDARLGEPIWHFAQTVRATMQTIALLALVTPPDVLVAPIAELMAAVIEQPFQIQELLDHVKRLTSLGAET